jgi:hypothetical protein
LGAGYLKNCHPHGRKGGIPDEPVYLAAGDVFLGPGLDGNLLPVPDRLRKNLKRGDDHDVPDCGCSNLLVRLPGGGPDPAGMVLNQVNGNPAIFQGA